jgi:DNA repair exonuclease SbcCD ATPase subunit
LSFFPNNEISNDNNLYSTGNIYPEQYAQYPQSSSSENAYYNNNFGSSVNYNYNSPVKNYENSILHKSRKTRVDKLTLSLKPQVENETNEQASTFLQSNNYESPRIDNNNIIETNYQSNEKIYSSSPTQNDIINNEKDKIIENLKNEINRLNLEISQLHGQNDLLRQENENLKLKNQFIKNTQDGNQSKEIIFRKEKESYIKEIENLRNQLGKLNEFEEYKRMKEEEISLLKTQIEELLSNQKRIEDFANQKQREIDELNLYIEELLNKQKQSEYEYQNMLRQTQQRETNMEDQMLSIQDTRLEVVKGDIIQNTKELELLTRKISKNNRKITLNLLYKATVDSDKAQAFHNKCDSVNNSLVLVKSANGKRFGGYTTCNWSGDSIDKKDENAFVFSLDKMKIYDIIPGEDAIGCYPKYGPVFLGCQIRIFDNFFSNGGTTFEKGMNYNTEEDYELSGGLNKFEVKEIEVYNVQLE